MVNNFLIPFFFELNLTYYVFLFLYSQGRNSCWIRQKMQKFPIDIHCKNRSLLATSCIYIKKSLTRRWQQCPIFTMGVYEKVEWIELSDPLYALVTLSKFAYIISYLLFHLECASGYYGDDCLEQCGNCFAGEDCDKVSGMCPSGCADGWMGLKCDLGTVMRIIKLNLFPVPVMYR